MPIIRLVIIFILWLLLGMLPVICQPELVPVSINAETDLTRLHQCYLDGNVQIRLQVVERFGQLGTPQVVDCLIPILTEKNDAVRARAAKVLGQVCSTRHTGAARVIAPLCAALQDPEAVVRGQAAASLGMIGDAAALAPLLAILHDADAGVRLEAIRALDGPAFFDPRSVEPLAAALRDADVDVRTTAMSALAKHQDLRALEPALAALLHTHPEKRRSAVIALSYFADPRAVQALMTATADADQEVRVSAIDGLGRFAGDPHVFDAIFARRQDTDAHVRVRVLAALCGQDITDPRLSPWVLTALHDESPEVRKMASVAILRLSAPEKP